ncbi:uncharacterized protein LOC131439195 [Malaya genurostris]|uniref:uncharacterized protein LOC131439195 n=1 Tax=Malaya genurostris TaxID=325434 RepID=UPI0026F3EDB3|nr:uncharacterized protein LOC131439195 [Malaya genurostris]
MSTGGVYVKAYSNNWLSQFGLYKYQSPHEVSRHVSYRHRKISLYGILAMAFVIFFILFIIVNNSESSRRQLIAESFSNETSIESSMAHSILTTPFSANEINSLHQQSIDGRNESKEVAEAVVQRRLHRLDSEAPTLEKNDNLVLFPSAYLKPPKLGSVRKFSDVSPLADNFQAASLDTPRPFRIPKIIEAAIPSGFTKQNRSYAGDDFKGLNPTRQRNHRGLVNNIQDVLKQLSSTKNQNLRYIPQLEQHPSEFSNPMYRNHKVKFTGIYRHPRKNGDITTLFGDASKQHELRVSKPQIINSQLSVPSVYMPDPLYNFRPANPSDINLLATNQFRFAPEKKPSTEEKPPRGMPFSIMLDIQPMTDGSFSFRRPTTRKRPTPNYSSINFHPYFNNHHFAQIKHAVPNQQYPMEDSYFRSSTSRHRSSHSSYHSTMKPGKLMVHLNLYPRTASSEADRKYEPDQSDYDINRLSLPGGDTLPDPERNKADSTIEPPRNYLEVFPYELFNTSSTTTTSLPPVPVTRRLPKVNVETFRSLEIPANSTTVDPIFHQHVGRKHVQQSPNLPIEARSFESPIEDHSRKLNVLSFNANDAV